MEEQLLKFLSTGPKNSRQIVDEFGNTLELWKSINVLVDQKKIIVTHLSCNSTWSKIEK